MPDFDDYLALAAGPRYMVHGKPALWNGTACQVIREAPDEQIEFGHTRLTAEAVILTVRVAEIAVVASGDIVVLNPNETTERTYRVMGSPKRDARGFEWRAEAKQS
jgi:hypothetical protein